MLDPDRLGFKVGDIVWVDVRGQRMFPEPRAIEAIYERDGVTWHRIAGSGTGVTADSLTLVPEQAPPPPDDPWSPGTRAAEVPITDGGEGCPFDSDIAEDFATDDVTAADFETDADATSAPDKAALLPNKSDISRHLYELFPPEFVKDFPDAWIEIAFANPMTGAFGKSGNFSAFDIKAAAEFAEKQNKAGFNVYVGAALRCGERCGRASAANFLAASHAWIDFDKQGDAERINAKLKANGSRPAAVVVTGTVPHRRMQCFFKLEGSATADQLKAANTALKELCGSDAVENVDRLLRLAGTISQ